MGNLVGSNAADGSCIANESKPDWYMKTVNERIPLFFPVLCLFFLEKSKEKKALSSLQTNQDIVDLIPLLVARKQHAIICNLLNLQMPVQCAQQSAAILLKGWQGL